mgnify:CR=1 FL=1
MAKKETNNQEQFKTMIGGQALIEGILMRGPEKQSIVVRSPEGLVVKTEPLKLVKDKYPILGLPFIRGVVNFGSSMVNGVKALMYSACADCEKTTIINAYERATKKQEEKHQTAYKGKKYEK